MQVGFFTVQFHQEAVDVGSCLDVHSQVHGNDHGNSVKNKGEKSTRPRKGFE